MQIKRVIYALLMLLVVSCSDSDKIYYEVKGNQVIYHSVYRKGQEYYTKAHLTSVVLTNADASTFKELSKYYGVDANNVYNEAKKLSRRDPSTFKIIKRGVTADKNAVYLDNKVIANSHGLSFKFISSNYAIDNHQVYYIPSNFYNVIKGADKKTFTKIGDQFSIYAKDKNRVYFKANFIEEADVVSFEILKSDFSKDSRNIFYKNKRITEVDYQSFKILDRVLKKHNYKFYAEDLNNFYGAGYNKKDKSYLKIIKKKEISIDEK